MKHNAPEKEISYKIHCQLYTSKLASCPSATSRLDEETFSQLLEFCTSEKHTECKIFQASREKGQAA